MKIDGITDIEEKIILENLSPYFKDYVFYYYGSRVKGDFRALSDLDILIKGKEKMPLEILDEIKQDFDNSNLPYIVNFADFYSITPEFYQTIKDDLVKIL